MAGPGAIADGSRMAPTPRASSSFSGLVYVTTHATKSANVHGRRSGGGGGRASRRRAAGRGAGDMVRFIHSGGGGGQQVAARSAGRERGKASRASGNSGSGHLEPHVYDVYLVGK